MQAITHHREVTAKRNIIAKFVDCVSFIIVGFIASTIVGVGSTLDGWVQVCMCVYVCVCVYVICICIVQRLADPASLLMPLSLQALAAKVKGLLGKKEASGTAQA